MRCKTNNAMRLHVGIIANDRPLLFSLQTTNCVIRCIRLLPRREYGKRDFSPLWFVFLDSVSIRFEQEIKLPSCNQSNLLCSLIPDVSITNVRMAPMVFMSSSSTQREPTVGRLRSRSIKRCSLMLITGFPVSILRKEPRSRVTMDDAGLEGKGGRGWFLRIGKTMESKSKRQEPSDSCQPVHKVRH